jgi:hypothetical protein
MTSKTGKLKALAMAATVTIGWGIAGSAYAGAPLVPDLITPPPNINVGIIYNQFSTADSFYTSNGTKVGNSHIATDAPIMRYVHTFSPIDGMISGVQVIAPYVAFLGNQHIGPGSLSTNSGFAEPLLSAFIFPINDPAHDQYLNFTYFISPPVGAFNSNANLNAGTKNWVNNIEAGYGHILAGQPKGKRLDFEIWADAYFYSSNNSFGSAPFVGKETEHTQTAEQIIAYLPYYFAPATAGYVGLGFEQTFGGKQTVTFQNVPGLTLDTGGRNDVTSVSIIAGTFVAPTVFVNAQLATDVRVRGGAKSTTLLFNVGKIF